MSQPYINIIIAYEHLFKNQGDSNNIYGNTPFIIINFLSVYHWSIDDVGGTLSYRNANQ